MLQFELNGAQVEVANDDVSLLEVLRDGLGVRSPKDGCSPQGQCGCCTVLVDGSPRVACVTPARRVAGRSVTTLEGLPAERRDAWLEAFTACGASQCGFCTPGIVIRLDAHREKRGGNLDLAEAEAALVGHLCRCTGWRTIVDAATNVGTIAAPRRDIEAANRRAEIEGGAPQVVGAEVAAGHGGFADDTAPIGALVAVPDGRGGWVVADSVTEARRRAGKVQGRNTTAALRHPIETPPGDWDITLRTTWVEPAYLEADASWCEPGGVPASTLANGGAFGGKVGSDLGTVARALADEYGRPVRVLLSREDVVVLGHKRPPIAAGIRRDGSGVMRVARTDGIAAVVAAVAPGIVVEEVEVPGPPTAVSLRAAGWAEAAILLAAARGEMSITSPSGATASATIDASGGIEVHLACGDPLDEIVLRSYCVGAAHMALGWVTSEGIAVDDDGTPWDLTIRSFGILRARDMPPVDVVIEDVDGLPVNGSDAVFAAVALAAWLREGLAPEWPTSRGAR